MSDRAPILAGVVGWPVEQSLSPLIHATWAQRAGIDGYYIPTPVPDDDDSFARVIAALRKVGFRGVNVTLPHKARALAIADAATVRARRAGAANTLTFGDDGVHADNTDIAGFAAALAEKSVTGKTAMMLGAGGAARGVALALIDAGFERILVANRTRDKAEALTPMAPGIEPVDWAARNDALAGADLLVNATSLGMTGKPPLEIALDAMPTAGAVADIVYNPLRTPLLQAAQNRGLTIVDGLAMLMHQAAPGFEAWFGATPQVDDALRRVLVAELERRAT